MSTSKGVDKLKCRRVKCNRPRFSLIITANDPGLSLIKIKRTDVIGGDTMTQRKDCVLGTKTSNIGNEFKLNSGLLLRIEMSKIAQGPTVDFLAVLYTALLSKINRPFKFASSASRRLNQRLFFTGEFPRAIFCKFKYGEILLLEKLTRELENVILAKKNIVNDILNFQKPGVEFQRYTL